jgi:hypothetical protein
MCSTWYWECYTVREKLHAKLLVAHSIPYSGWSMTHWLLSRILENFPTQQLLDSSVGEDCCSWVLIWCCFMLMEFLEAVEDTGCKENDLVTCFNVTSFYVEVSTLKDIGIMKSNPLLKKLSIPCVHSCMDNNRHYRNPRLCLEFVSVPRAK